MRSELKQLEQIDQYLSGNMTPEQATSFEAKMNGDPVLKSMVQDQQLLIQTVNRNAMMAEINAVAGISGVAGTSAGWGIIQWAITGISVIGATVAGVFIYDAVTDDSTSVETSSEKNILAENASLNENDKATLYLSDSIRFEFEMGVDESDDDTDETNLSYDEAYGETMRTTTTNEVVTDKNNLTEQRESKDPLNSFSDLKTPRDKGEKENIAVEDPGSNSISGTEKNRRASFPGGETPMKNWFEKNLKYPGTAKANEVQGTVKVRFFVEPNGKVKVIDSECFILQDAEGTQLDGFKRLKHRKSIKYFERNAQTAFRICPDWIPATNSNGTAVLSEQVWYVRFVLNGKSEVYTYGNGKDSESDYKKELNYVPQEEMKFEIYTAEDDFINADKNEREKENSK
ncbi:MAG: hypothetical protein HUJ25_18125 [Crocinitomicaceae bacterium]|nr:hypothetical protein [Crocinitomicaceae bacterium]